MTTTLETSPFTLDGKALSTTELQSGDLLLDGYCVVFDGLDASGENFLRGALKDASGPFLAGPAGLAFQHDAKTILGRVLSLEEDAKGIRMKARVDRQEPGSPHYHLYDRIRRTKNVGLSIGGFFQRASTPFGRMIDRVLRLTEISVTWTPQHALTGANAVEVKAMMGGASELDALQALGHRLDVAALRLDVAEIQASARTR